MKFPFANPICITLFMLFLISCSGDEKAQTDNLDFEIAILDFNAREEPEFYDMKFNELMGVIVDQYPSNAIYSISGENIETYDWENQVITLSENETQNLVSYFFCNFPGTCLAGQGFVVIHKGEVKYGGVFSFRIDRAQYIDFPLIYPELEDKKLKLTITPNNSRTSIIWERIKVEDIRLDFEREGKIIK